jgi:hypothetical protein
MLSARDKTIALVGAILLVGFVIIVASFALFQNRDISTITSVVSFAGPTISILLVGAGLGNGLGILKGNQDQIKSVVNATAQQVNGNTSRLMDANDSLTQQLAVSSPPNSSANTMPSASVLPYVPPKGV